MTEVQKEKTISFSSFSLYHECPYKWKLSYIDGKKFAGNIFSSFGKAVHSSVEKKIKVRECDEVKTFLEEFKKSLKELPKEEKNKIPVELIKEFRLQGEKIVPLVLVALDKKYPGFELVDIEKELKEEIELGFKFVGYVDIIIKYQDKYYILDFKTCSWGWDAEKKTDKIVTYQLAFYKNFFARQKNIPLADIETGFVLLKRIAKKNEVEFVRVSCGEKKIKNATKMLYNTCLNINSSNFPKNRSSCTRCQFHNTDDCKKW